jgi:hypothetical protein
MLEDVDLLEGMGNGALFVDDKCQAGDRVPAHGAPFLADDALRITHHVEVDVVGTSELFDLGCGARSDADDTYVAGDKLRHEVAKAGGFPYAARRSRLREKVHHDVSVAGGQAV